MSISLNKARAKQIVGLDDIAIPAPVAEWQRMQNNGDGTITVIIDFYKDQQTLDDGGQPFETKSYQIDTHPNVDNYLKSEFKKLADFDQST